MELKLKKIVEFLKNRGLNYSISKKGVIILERKFLLVPHGWDQSSNLDIVQVDFNNENEFINVISKIVNLKIYKDILKVYHLIKKNPWYSYNNDILNESWDSIKQNKNNKCFKIIKHFHLSLLDSKRNKSQSPREFLSNRKNILFLIKNRFIYSKNVTPESVFSALSISKRSPIVSIFSPILVRKLINQHYSDCKNVIDPFSGFSGRMLGTLSLGKKYFGGDIRGDVINESKDILDFINEFCHLEVSDFKDFSVKTGDLLLTCPPYGRTELWNGVNEYYDEDYYIDWILQNYNCKKYIFVVKKTKYTNNIVDTIKNGSWVKNTDSEKILLFNKGIL